jgi:hypothetical protein
MLGCSHKSITSVHFPSVNSTVNCHKDRPNEQRNKYPATNATMPLDPSTFETRLFINNEFVPSKSGKTFPTVNPATEEVITRVHEADAADVDVAVRVCVCVCVCVCV